MANSDYTSRPGNHGFCPVGFLSADIGPLDSAVTMTGYTSPVADGIRVGMAAMITKSAPSSFGATDPYWDNVVLLVQGGTDASTTIRDYSKYGITKTIVNYAAFDDAHQVYGANNILSSTVSSAVNRFYSNGIGTHLSRDTGTKMTIEFWCYIGTLVAGSPAGYFFRWQQSSNGNIMQMGVSGTTPKLWMQNGTDAAVETADITTGALHFVQVNIDGTAYTVDLDGVEVYSGTNSWWINTGGEYAFFVASQNATGSASGGTTQIWTTPLRVTKGILRPRGTVPSESFAVEGAWLVESDTSTISDVSDDGRTFSYSPIAADFRGAWVHSPDARSGKRYWEFLVDGATAGDTLIGLMAQSEFVAIAGNERYPLNPFGESFWGIHNGGPFTSVGTLTNGSHSTDSTYSFTTGDVIGVAVDFDTGSVWFSKNGTWFVGDPAAGTSPTFSGLSAALDPYVTFYNSTGTLSVTANFKPEHFVSAPPTGFTELPSASSSPATAFTQEIVVVTAQSGNDLTLGRGCCDTVPAAHSAGDAIWFFDDSLGSDKFEYAGTETIGVKVVPRVTAGSLPIEHAPAAELEFNLRFARPYPPGMVKVNGSPWFTTPLVLDSVTPTLGLTWAHRDRVTQQDQLIDHLEASIGPETGTTYEIRVYRSTGALVRTVTGLTGTSWDYTLAEAAADFSAAGDEYPGYITLNSARDGLLSFQEYRIDFTLDSDGVSVVDDALTVTVSLPVQPAAVTIALAHTQAATPASPGGSLVRFFTPALTLAEPVPAGQTFAINFGERSNNAGPSYYVAQYQTTEPTTRATIVAALRQQIEYLLVNTTSPALSDFIDIVTVSDYSGSKWLHLVGKFGIEFMAEGTGQPDPPGVSRPFVTGSNTSMLSWANGAAVVPVALPQIITATLTGSPAAGDRCTITLNGTAFSHTSLTSESADAVATALAALIDADPNYAASAVGAVVTIDGLTATNVFAYSATSESLFAF